MEEIQRIHWFPGHMARARRKMQEALQLVDAVLEVRDARCPKSSGNPDFLDLLGRKPRVLLLNKCDLTDDKATVRWQIFFEKQGEIAIIIDCKSGKGVEKIAPAISELLREKIEKNLKNGMNTKLRAMVAGVPNTGKSTIINRLAGRAKAIVQNRPGVTRGNQFFAIGRGMELLDTPGVLWPKFEDARVAENLAFVGSIKDEILDAEGLAARLLEVLHGKYWLKICSRYGFAETMQNTDGLWVLQQIAKARNMRISGGDLDLERASRAVLEDFRSGRLGKISLEVPENG